MFKDKILKVFTIDVVRSFLFHNIKFILNNIITEWNIILICILSAMHYYLVVNLLDVLCFTHVYNEIPKSIDY